MRLKTDKKKSPEMIKKELLSPVLENVNEKKLRINEVVRNANQLNKTIQIIKK